MTSLTAEMLPSATEILEPSPGAILRRRIFGDWGVMIGGGVLLAIILMAIFAPLIAPHDPLDQDLYRKYIPPIWHDKGNWEFLLGTDRLGRDFLSRLIYGAQISLLIGFSAMLISGVIGTALGVAAGYFGGRVDIAITFLITCRLAMPVILVALAVDGIHSRLPPDENLDREEAFVPDPALARIISLGFGAVIADFYWLQAIQAVGGNVQMTPRTWRPPGQADRRGHDPQPPSRSPLPVRRDMDDRERGEREDRESFAEARHRVPPR
jgi:ABC-type dipeptide/oligopeptide/nickel transport system permease subunit